MHGEPALEVIPSVALDVSTDIWDAHFPDLGAIRLFPGDHVAIRVVGTDADTERYRALRWGWAEPLQFLRAGFWLTSLTMIDPDGRALIVTGAARQESALVDKLSAAGWRLVADAMTPAQLSEAGLRVTARKAPALRKRVQDRYTTLVRNDSNVAEYPQARATGDYPVIGVLRIGSRRSNDEAGLRRVRGGKKMEVASHLLSRGPLPPETLTPQEGLQRDLQLAALDMAELLLDDTANDVLAEQVLTWWQGL